MSRPCSTCARPDRLVIDNAILAGASVKGTAARFGMSDGALRRHIAAEGLHSARTSAPRASQPDGVEHSGIDELVRLLADEVANTTGRARLDASREYRLALAEAAKSGGSGAAPSLKDFPGWSTFKRLVGESLAPHPEARQALIDAIRAFEAGV